MSDNDVSIAFRNLLKDKTRLALSIGGIALAIMLILILDGFRAGMFRQITAYVDHSTGSIIVAQEGVNNLLGISSLLPEGSASKIKKVEGVADAIPILSQFVILDLHGKKQPAYMVGYSPARGGGPWRLAVGREPSSDREVVFDRVLAERHKIHLGSTVEILDKDFTVVGLSDGTASWMTSFFFVRKSAAEDLLLAPGATSFLLVTIHADASPEAVRDRINRMSNVNALLKSDVAANDLKLFGRYFSAPIQLMSGIAFLVGTLVVGLVIYTATVERRREYGVLKAIGARNGMLYRVVAAQALIAALSGTIIGVGLAFAVSEWIMAARPQFLIVFESFNAAQTILIGLSMALIAALFPARVLAELAPAEVFRK